MKNRLHVSKNFIVVGLIILTFIVIIFYSKDLHTKNNICTKVGAIIFSDDFAESFLAFQNEIRKYGYNSIEFEVENINGNLDAIKDILNRFKEKGIKIIYATTTPVNQKIKELNDNYNFYVIFAQVASPKESKLVLDESSSGTNFVGVTRAAFKMTEKRISIFKDMFPSLRKLIVFYGAQENFLKEGIKKYYTFVKKLDMEVELVPIVDPQTIKNYRIENPEISGIFMAPSAFSVKYFSELKKLSEKYNIPIMAIDTNLVKKGATVAYSQSFSEDGAQSAYILYLLLRGFNPKNLPVRMPTKIDLFVNKKNIEKIGRNFNQLYYSYADMVIE